MSRNVIQRLRERQGTIVVGSIVTIAFNGMAILLYGVGSIFAARALGPTEWGLALWFITGTTTVALFADVFGVYYANAYLVARGHSRFASRVVRGSVLAYGAGLGAVVGVLFVGIRIVRHTVFHGLSGATWAVFIAASITGLAFVNQIRGILLGGSQFIALGALTLLKSGGFGVMAVVLAYPMRMRSGLAVGGAHLLSTLACVVAGGLYCVRLGVGPPSLEYLRACTTVGWRGFAVTICSFLHQRISQYLVNIQLGAMALGLYGVAVSLGEVVTQLPAMLGLVLFPSAAGDRDPVAVDRRTLRLALGTVVVMAVAMIPLYAAAPYLIRGLFGASYEGAIPVVRMFTPAVALLSGLLVLNPHISGTGYPVGQLVIMAAALVLNAGLNVVLLSRVGVVGASLAASISYGVWFALGVWFLRHLRGARA